MALCLCRLLLLYISTIYLFNNACLATQYDYFYAWSDGAYQTYCSDGKLPKPQPFKHESDIISWYKVYVFCRMGWFNEKTFGAGGGGIVNVVDQNTVICMQDEYGKCLTDDFSLVSQYMLVLTKLVDYESISFNVVHYDETSFEIVGKERCIIDEDAANDNEFAELLKNNKFGEKWAFKFDNNDNGILVRFDRLGDSHIWYKLMDEKKKKNSFAVGISNINTAGITNKRIHNEPYQPEIPQKPYQAPQLPSPVVVVPVTFASKWFIIIGAILAVILALNIMFMCYVNCWKKISFNSNRRNGYNSVKHADSEDFDDSEANLINVDH